MQTMPPPPPPLSHLTAEERRLLHRPKGPAKRRSSAGSSGCVRVEWRFHASRRLGRWSWTSTAGRNAQWAVGASPRQWPVSGGILHCPYSAAVRSGLWSMQTNRTNIDLFRRSFELPLHCAECSAATACCSPEFVCETLYRSPDHCSCSLAPGSSSSR